MSNLRFSILLLTLCAVRAFAEGEKPRYRLYIAIDPKPGSGFESGFYLIDPKTGSAIGPPIPYPIDPKPGSGTGREGGSTLPRTSGPPPPPVITDPNWAPPAARMPGEEFSLNAKRYARQPVVHAPPVDANLRGVAPLASADRRYIQQIIPEMNMSAVALSESSRQRANFAYVNREYAFAKALESAIPVQASNQLVSRLLQETKDTLACVAGTKPQPSAFGQISLADASQATRLDQAIVTAERDTRGRMSAALANARARILGAGLGPAKIQQDSAEWMDIFGPPMSPPSAVEQTLLSDEEKQRQSAWKELAQVVNDRASDEAKDYAKEKGVEFVFGEGAARLLGRVFLLNDALETVVLADGTITGKINDWKVRCEQFVGKEQERDQFIAYGQEQRTLLETKTKSPSSPEEQQFVREAIQVIDRMVREERAVAKYNLKARVWCERFIPAATKFLAPKPQSVPVRGLN